MESFHQDTLVAMENWLQELESKVPKPIPVRFRHGYVHRYKEKSSLQAIIQKLARIISGLYSIQALADNGYYQEQATLQRVHDEICEDVSFLYFSILSIEKPKIVEEYLSSFWEEEFNPIASDDGDTQARAMPSRRKIRAFIANSSPNSNPSSAISSSKIIHKVYSGYVHAASPHIMDMYNGVSYQVKGMLGTPREQESNEDIKNYYYRGILAFGIAAKAFGENGLFERIILHRDNYEKVSNVPCSL